MKVWVLYFSDGAGEYGEPEGVFKSAKAAMDSVHSTQPFRWEYTGRGYWQTLPAKGEVLDPCRVAVSFTVRKKPLAEGRRK